MAEQLELAELLQRHGVSEVDVRRGGIDAEFHAQRTPEPEFFEQFLFGQDLGGSGGEMGELLFGRHGMAGATQTRGAPAAKREGSDGTSGDK